METQLGQPPSTSSAPPWRATRRLLPQCGYQVLLALWLPARYLVAVCTFLLRLVLLPVEV